MTTADSPLPEPATADLDPYRIRDRPEILALMRALARERALLGCRFGTGASRLPTRVLSMDPALGELVLELGRDLAKEASRHEGQAACLVGLLDGVKVQFEADGAQVIAGNGNPALRVRLPESVVRLQRREAFRLRAPVLRPPECLVPAGPGHPASRFRVLDLSCEGLALVASPGQPDFAVGSRLAACTLDLPGAVPLRVDLDVIRAAEHVTPSGNERRTCGCRFARLPGPAAHAIQRYIHAVERQWRQRVG
jgi:c-di-GMP-binding flagellar brake protein YcgR